MQHRNHKGANTFSWHWTDILTYQLINRLTYSFRNGKGSRQYVICEHNMCFRVGRKREEFFIEVPKNSNVQLFCIRLRLIGIMDEPETFPGWRLWTGGYWIVSLDGLGSHLHGWKYFKVNKGCKTWEQVIKCVRTDRMGSVPTRLSLPICALSLIG